MKKFPMEIGDFAEEFVQAQSRRHSADYDPDAIYDRYEVLGDIDDAELAIKNFRAASTSDRRAFAAWVTLRKR